MKYIFAIICILAINASCFLQKDVSKVPTIEIAPGVHMPMVGLGTWQYNDTKVYDAATKALKIGYRAIDAAFDYGNAKGIGKALQDSGLSRDQYFITAKVEGGLNYTHTLEEAFTQLKELQIPYADLLLLHFPHKADWTPFTKEGRAEQWKAMEFLHKQGHVRALGVSHFCRNHYEELMETAEIKPALNQVEYHIGMGTAGPNATDDKNFFQSQNVTYQPFSELCGPCCMGKPDNCTLNRELITGKMVTDIGAKYNKSGAQVSLKWLVQQGLPIIPKSHHVEYLEQNIDLFDFELSEEDMSILTTSQTPPVCGGGDGFTSGDCAFE